MYQQKFKLYFIYYYFFFEELDVLYRQIQMCGESIKPLDAVLHAELNVTKQLFSISPTRKSSPS